jgi:hypothetical protein
MWNKGFRILWVKVKTENPEHHVHLHFPVPLYIFQELLDCLLDLIAVASLFVPRTSASFKSPTFSIHAAKEMIQMTIKLIDSLAIDGPYDLVEVTNDNVRVSIKIR